MSFWDELEELEREELEKAKAQRDASSSQNNTPTRCHLCGKYGPEVLLGLCDDCAR